ncbi:hypothetical protein AVEN_196308-1 [Araneus ventricosus]|uniref:Rho termination factor N-terminal domain-containing protein n=1 Tax=Araneus ventricosus TaxID=182803 RepID=A0A4Y2AUS3_ARAVE|nr:hypothetical protein AVEN_196308-1 [Araneus ventricosus]
MTAIAKLKKDELKLVAEEIGLAVTEGMKKSEIRRLIEESEVFTNDNGAVKDAIDQVLEEKKNQISERSCERRYRSSIRGEEKPNIRTEL